MTTRAYDARVPELARPILLLHILAAFAYIAGYTATNVLTEFARRTDDIAYRQAALGFSNRFDRLLNQTGGTAVALTGLIAIWAFGYSLFAPWILASIVLWIVVMFLGIVYWARFGGRVDAARAAGDEAEVTRLLRAPRIVAISRGENLMVLAILVLMILRPGS